MKRIALPLTFAIFLSACGQNHYEYEGKYLIAEGEECTPDTESKDRDVAFIEIIPQGKNENKTYIAKIPRGATWNLPTTSNGNSSPTEKNELNFSFSKEGESGFLSTKPSVDMTITVIPHETKENHIWLTKWDATLTKSGTVKQISYLDALKNKLRNIPFSNKGLCLSKIVTPT